MQIKTPRPNLSPTITPFQVCQNASAGCLYAFVRLHPLRLMGLLSKSVFNVQEVHVNSEKPKMEYAANGESVDANYRDRQGMSLLHLIPHRYPTSLQLKMEDNNQPILPEKVTPPALAYSQPPTTYAPSLPTPVGIHPAYSRALSVYLQPPASSSAPLAHLGTSPPYAPPPPAPAAQAPPCSDDAMRIAALEGIVNKLAADIVELMALLRGSSRTFSSSAPPLAHGQRLTRPFGSRQPMCRRAMLCPFPHLRTSQRSVLLQSALEAPPTYTPPVVETEQERLMKRMEKLMRAIKESDSRVMEMREGQSFEDYANHWRAEAAKHHPSIDETMQIQIFHGTLKSGYYLHLLGHMSSFFDMIKIGKNVFGFENSSAGPVKPPNVQDNPYPDHGSSSSVAIDIYTRGKDKVKEEELASS
ncbi:hypothetical protein CRG98_037857 [Punica granatum]|uniref:Uncharacterized protein n=1 Tax=Punica granatum TaxID=22663 RepID=A0A2I0ICP4_PUNGR|nr:hypothetical protein CRG98_037857 [Punica granatum]